jgi:hypothetical protein
LAGDAQLVGDLGSGVAGGKQGTGLHADAFERLAVTQTAGVAAVGGWSHAAMLPGQPPIKSSELTNLFKSRPLQRHIAGMVQAVADHRDSSGCLAPADRRRDGQEPPSRSLRQNA